MKKILLTAGLLTGIFFFQQSQAQCTFSGLGVKVNSYSNDPVTGHCIADIDLYFNIHHNPGGKYFWIHIWPTNQYPASFDYSKPPTTSLIPGGNGALDNSLTTFGYWHQGGELSPQMSYPPDPNVPGFQYDYAISEVEGPTYDRYTIRGLKINLPLGCDIAQSLTADAWESQSATAQNVHCVSRNQPFYINDPNIVNGILFCELPRSYSFQIKTLSPNFRTINYEVRIDDGDGLYNADLDNMLINSGSADIRSGDPYQSPRIYYPPYNNQKPYADRALWVIVKASGTDLPNDIYYRIENSCIPLPVTFLSFTAQRNKETVQLRWTTASEFNSKGFYVERKNGTGDWQVLTYVASAAPDGNSNAELNYSWNDLNNLKGVSEYRLRQTDLDNRISYSEIRMVKGPGQAAGLLVYPNPSRNGTLNIVLDNLSSPVDIQLIDINGRVVKQVLNNTRNQVSLNGVQSGIYTLRVWTRETRDFMSTKVVVQQ